MSEPGSDREIGGIIFCIVTKFLISQKIITCVISVIWCGKKMNECPECHTCKNESNREKHNLELHLLYVLLDARQSLLGTREHTYLDRVAPVQADPKYQNGAYGVSNHSSMRCSKFVSFVIIHLI